MLFFKISINPLLDKLSVLATAASQHRSQRAVSHAAVRLLPVDTISGSYQPAFFAPHTPPSPVTM
jgi:hypothetical protein